MHMCVYIERELDVVEGLAAELRVIGINTSRRRRRRRRKIVIIRTKVMSCWHKIAFPVRRLLFAVATRIKARKNCGGLLKLHDDIQTCGYEDVQVMWEMLRRTESDLISPPSKQKLRPFWKIFVWENHNDKSSFSINHA